MTAVGRLTMVLAGTVAVFVVASILWMLWLTWNESKAVAGDYSQYSTNTLFVPRFVLSNTIRVNNAFLNLQLGNEPDSYLEYKNTVNEITELLEEKKQQLTTRSDHILYEEILNAFDDYLDTAGLVAGGEEHPLKLSVGEMRNLRVKSEVIIELTYKLEEQQREHLMKMFVDYRKITQRLAWLVGISLFLIFVMIGIVLWGVDRNRFIALRLRLSQSLLKQQEHEKLAVVGTMASGMAHEVRNPLTAIKARLFALNKQIGTEPKALAHINVIEGEINRLERIVKEFLAFARPPQPEKGSFDVQTFLKEVYDFLFEELGSDQITLKKIEGEDMRAFADKEQIRQVIINLVQNAADASKPGGVVELKAYRTEYSTESGSIPAVAVEVKDEGTGIPQELKERIFDPFVSTKNDGNGLGLPIARRIARSHNGEIVFKSELGVGSTFTLLIPEFVTVLGPHSLARF